MKKKVIQNLWDFSENVSLAPYTSFHIGGPAKYFVQVKTDEEIAVALDRAKKLKVAYFILGGGTNLLISDKGFDGLVIRMSNSYELFDGVHAKCGAGCSLQKFIDESVALGLAGLESMAGIGGTVGGAIRGNAGAFGQSIEGVIKKVYAIVGGAIKEFSHKDCGFKYRDSVFKREKLVITSAEFQFARGDASLLKARVKEIITMRNSRYNEDWQCAGCVFKNVDLQTVQVDEKKVIKALDITEEEYKEATKHKKLPVSFIVDKLGLKGKKMGGAQIAQEHGAFIINAGGAKAEDVVMLMSYVTTKVRNLLGIQLEPEIELVGL